MYKSNNEQMYSESTGDGMYESQKKKVNSSGCRRTCQTPLGCSCGAN